MFYLSKLFYAFTQPLTWVALLLLLSLWWQRRRPKPARRALWAALLVLWTIGWLPLSDALLRQLENAAPPPTAQALGPLSRYHGVVVLGGALERGDIWQAHQQVGLNDAAERMTHAVILARQQPHLRLLFTGGEGDLWALGISEADQAKVLFNQLGVAAERVQYESASRTTYENATLSAALPGVDKTQPWLLLTSAWHMPRSLAAFRAAGWNVMPYAVDYRTSDSTSWTEYSLARGAARWQLLLHECLGWLAYKVTGRA